MPAPERLSLRPSTCTFLGLAAANLPFATIAWAQATDSTSRELPQVSVEGSAGSNSGYQVDAPSFGKLTGPLVDTPQSITEVPRQLLNDQGVTTMRDALRNVPGISLAAGEGGQQGDNLSIRGFNAQNDFFLDDVRDFGSYYRDPFNLETIEVLKGPASVLFGRGSTGGAINQVSKQPVLTPITAGTLSFGTDGTARMTTDVNRPIQGLNGAALRMNLMADRNDVAGRDDAEFSRFGFAPELAFGLGTPTRVTLDYFHFQEYDTPDYGIPWLSGRPAPVPQRNFYGYPDSDFFRTNVNIGTAKIEHDFNDNITVNDQFRYGTYQRAIRVTEPQIIGFGPATGIVSNPLLPLSALTVSRHTIALSSQETILDNQTNATIHFDTGPIKHTLVTGVEIARQTSDPTRYTYGTTATSLLSPVPVPFTQSPTVSSITNTIINNYGIYAIDTISIGPYVDLIGGWRWDRFDSTFHQSVPTRLNLTRNDDLPTYHGAVVVKPTTDGSIYFDYGTSFDPSAESLSLTAATATVAPEKTTIYEVGTKWNLLHQRVSLTGALYQEQKSNVRETDPNNPLADILAGNYRVRGFEIGVTGHLTDRWQVFGGYNYNDAIVVSSPNPKEVGHTPPNAPAHTLTAWTEYRLPWHNVEIGGGINFVSARTASSTPVSGTNIIERAPGYWTMSLMAKYPITPNLSLQVNVTNVTNTYYFDELHPGHIILGPARAALFTISAKL
ncbi:MAG TPA: TonB-dependent siderophore receptor [Rhodopila sp.]|uniref:TonB-dependent receptor n=1 Tax=Rhodopila sp. TaxID=2480087 RepID=UPI002C01CA15|nr:TonB-dependent siderophore receptor [Rhodopila sp.]HVY14549.1 TonB-dependent siderophore receptor [Rhodopila sp.]